MMRLWGTVFGLRPAAVGWATLLRSVAPAILLLVGFGLAGRLAYGLIAALGAYITMFGVGQPARRRFRTLAAAAVFLLASVSLGIATAGFFWLTLVVYLAVAMMAVTANIMLELGSPGPYFFVLMVGGGSTVGGVALPLSTILLFLSGGCALAVAFAMADVLVDPRGTERRAIEAAGRAVASLRVRVADGCDVGELGGQIGETAAAVDAAWSAWLAGGGGAPDNDRLAGELRRVNREWREFNVDIVARRLLPDVPMAASLAIDPELAGDPARLAIGPPSLGFRLANELRWPSMTLITLIRVSVALVLASIFAHWTRDQHPFWSVLVVVLVLSYPGGPARLTIRAVQRLIGTAVGIGAFALLLEADLGETASVLLLAMLLLVIAAITARNYLYGSIVITVLALYMTAPMTTVQSPSELAANRLVDTLAAVSIALLLIWAIGPRLAPALAIGSVRRIARPAIAVVDQVLAGRPLADPAFAEDRRRLQYGLLRAGRDARLAAASPERPEAELERHATRLGYLILEASWLRGSDSERKRLIPLRERLERIAGTNRDDIAALRQDIDRARADLEA